MLNFMEYDVAQILVKERMNQVREEYAVANRRAARSVWHLLVRLVVDLL